MQTDLDSLRFPIGKFKIPESYSKENFADWIHQIRELPKLLYAEVSKLSNEQLNTPYREGGWSIRQVVHHLADSHINSYCRFKLALTEETPSIRPYYEDRWALLEDGKNAPIEISLKLLDALHTRWVYMLERMSEKDWERKFFHPESKREFELKTILALYAWHSEHHLQHIVQLKKRMNWINH